MANKEDTNKKGSFHAMEERVKELQRQSKEHEGEDERKSRVDVGEQRKDQNVDKRDMRT